MFRVLFVCTGNICRSPAAERLARHLLPFPDQVQSHSAGTHAREGESIHPFTAEALRARGADVAGFSGRQLAEPLIAESDLVLTATREQRGHAVAMYPLAVQRSFTLLEFGALAALVEPAFIRPAFDTSVEDAYKALLAEVRQLRGTIPPRADGFDLSDPYGSPPQVHEEMTTQLSDVLRDLSVLITGMSLRSRQVSKSRRQLI